MRLERRDRTEHVVETSDRVRLTAGSTRAVVDATVHVLQLRWRNKHARWQPAFGVPAQKAEHLRLGDTQPDAIVMNRQRSGGLTL